MPSRSTDSFTLAAAAAALGAAALVAASEAPASADIADVLDQAAGEIDVPKWLAGKPVQLAKLRGRVVILHFSDPERITSQAAVPQFRKVVTAWKDQPVTIVEIVTTPIEAAAVTYAAKDAPTWAIGWDAKNVTSWRYPGTSIPRTYLIGPDGRVIWHAHIQALTKDLVQGQVDRVQFFELAPGIKRARTAAKLASEQKFAEAAVESRKVEIDPVSTDADKALLVAIRADIARTHAMYAKIVETLIDNLDWGAAWLRAKRMTEMFKGTEFEEQVNAKFRKLDEYDRVQFVLPAHLKFEELVIEASKAKGRRDIDEVIGKLKTFCAKYHATKPGERAEALVQQLEKRKSELPPN